MLTAVSCLPGWFTIIYRDQTQDHLKINPSPTTT